MNPELIILKLKFAGFDLSKIEIRHTVDMTHKRKGWYYLETSEPEYERLIKKINKDLKK